MARQTILLPYNFSVMDQKALAFTADIFGRQEDARLTLLHVYTPIPSIETDSSTVMGRLSSSMQFLSVQLHEKEDALKEVVSGLIQDGFSKGEVNYLFRSRTRQIADEIIATAREGKYETIVLSYRPHRVTRVFVQSVHHKIMSSIKHVTVCIVT